MVCPNCNGKGKLDSERVCFECAGSGRVTREAHALLTRELTRPTDDPEVRS